MSKTPKDSEPSKLLAHEQIAELETALKASQEKAEENWDKLLRSVAELENVKRRAEKDIADAHRYALNRFIDDLIPIVDSLEQAVLSCAEGASHEAMRSGLELTLKMFMSSLEKFGVKLLNPMGEPFDPNLHEAMMMQESKDAAPNTVLVVVQKGYRVYDRLIRPARVVVAKELNN